jgi:hypothetical protein
MVLKSETLNSPFLYLFLESMLFLLFDAKYVTLFLRLILRENTVRLRRHTKQIATKIRIIGVSDLGSLCDNRFKMYKYIYRQRSFFTLVYLLKKRYHLQYATILEKGKRNCV